MQSINQKNFMSLALAEAKTAGFEGEIPIGAVLVDFMGRIVSTSRNAVRAKNDPTAHAEMEVIRAGAQKFGRTRLNDCDLYVTLEPCPMCAQAISLARIRRLYYGAFDPKGGGVEHGPTIFSQPSCNHKPEIVSGVQESQSVALLQDFFMNLR